MTAGPNVSQSPGVQVSVSSTFSDPAFNVDGSSETYTATINWGDGTTPTSGTVTTTPGGPWVPTTGTISGTHTYAAHGNYTVTVTVLDSQGNSGSSNINVLDVPPTVTAGPDETVNQGSPVVVAATFTDPGFEAGTTAASYPVTINWGDGTPATPGTVTLTPGGPASRLPAPSRGATFMPIRGITRSPSPSPTAAAESAADRSRRSLTMSGPP